MLTRNELGLWRLMGADSTLLTLALKTRMASEAARADLPRRGWRCAVGRNSPWRDAAAQASR
ncbi:hypothetical protein M3484_13640 [Pseudomonas sp. GX19020]|uniref:hypothetical protein n=1 Tax=Pseudomonas sp. GX19020 TaxID=2942277 RepID=UPI0020191216|nr:hypothetical protein [Pseudomonas sp. GX19020]MCL4067615.1 hypothetical protein [Pseudomonas sp. GX19020]